MPGQNQIRENIPLAPLTTFGIGGPARYFVDVRLEDQLAPALAFASARQLPVFILGGGSNLLVSDDGFPGLVLHVALHGMTSRQSGDRIILTANAGEIWDRLVESSVAAGLAGIECLSGIPGSVGGTPVQNVGAYGQEVSETITRVRAFDRVDGRIVELLPADCAFSYRASIFNTTLRERYIVLAVDFALKPDGAPMLGYTDLRGVFADAVSPPTLPEVRHAVLQIRARKGMLIDADEPESRSAGSFFKNPVIERTQYERLASEFGDPAPGYATPEGRVKVPAAWLIERAGFRRGETRGRAAISSKHTLALVNRGGAKARELLTFAAEIVERVNERFGIKLAPEPVFVGFGPGGSPIAETKTDARLYYPAGEPPSP